MIFQPRLKNLKGSGTGFFISADGYFIATYHGFEQCMKNPLINEYYGMEGIECTEYEGVYSGEAYRLFLIAHPAPKTSTKGNEHINNKILETNFILGRLELKDNLVPFFSLYLPTPELVGDNNSIAKVNRIVNPETKETVELNRLSEQSMPIIYVSGFRADNVQLDVRTLLTAFDTQRYSYLIDITRTPISFGMSGGSPVVDLNDNLLGMFISAGQREGVVISKQRIIDRLSEIHPEVKSILLK